MNFPYNSILYDNMLEPFDNFSKDSSNLLSEFCKVANR